MSWKEPQERHSDALIEAIHAASRHIASSIEKGFKHMADAQTKALADLNAALTNIADAISAEIAALQAALANTGQPDDSGQIEAAVSKLNDLTAALKTSIPKVAPASPVVTGVSPTSGVVAGGTSISVTGSGFTGATKVLIGGADATGVTVIDDNNLTAITPAGTGTGQAVVVTTPAGSSDAKNATFNFV